MNNVEAKLVCLSVNTVFFGGGLTLQRSPAGLHVGFHIQPRLGAFLCTAAQESCSNRSFLGVARRASVQDFFALVFGTA